jgi:hypothetical protein
MVAAKVVSLRKTNPSETLLLAGLKRAGPYCERILKRAGQALAANNNPTTEVLAGLVERSITKATASAFCV